MSRRQEAVPAVQPFDRDELAALFDDVLPQDLYLPDLRPVDWGVLDFLGWIHPAGHLGYVALRVDGEAVGLAMQRTRFTGRRRRTHMCAWCHMLRPGSEVAMFSRYVDGSNGRVSVGVTLCGALDCSLRLRNLTGDPRLVMPENYGLAWKVRRLEDAVETYVRRVRPVF